MREIACVRGVLGKDADGLTDAELDAVVKDLKRRQRERARLNEGMSAAEAINLEAAGVAADLAIAAKVEKRNAALNIVKRKEAMRFTEEFPSSASGLEALLTGTNRKIRGGRGQSVDAKAREKHGRYLGGFISDLKRDGVYDLVTTRWLGSGKGPLDDKIAIELYEIRDGGSPGRSGSADARKIATIIHRYQELARADQNRAGAFIRKMPGYIVAQSHDMMRIRRAGKQEWIAKTLPLLDADRTFDGADPVEFLSGVYDELASGTFYKADADGVIAGFKGPANLAKKVSQARVLHFKGAEAWIAYNDSFGLGSLMEAVTFGLGRAARNAALMEALGPNPKAMFEGLIEHYRQAAIGNPAEAAALSGSRLHDMMAVADGSVDIPGNVTAASVGRAIRTFESVTKLGGAVLSSLPDVATAAAALTVNGKGFLSSLGAQTTAFFAGLPNNSIRREVAERIGAGIDGDIGSILSRFDAADNLPGRMAKLQSRFFKLNLLTWWTDAQETGFASILSRDLAMLSDRGFATLPERQARVLLTYGIGEAEWDVIRAHGLWRDKNGGRWVMPDTLRDAPDEAFAGLIDGKATKTKTDAARLRLESALRSYYLDRTSFGVLKGGVREKFGATGGGARAGTWGGEGLRAVMQFKSYSIGFVNKVLGQFTDEDKFTRIPIGLWRAPLGEKAQVAKLVLALTALGYVSVAMKDIAKGREPRDPTDPKTWAAAFLQGGGAGIYGDFLFADFNRAGGSALATLAGPAFGTADDAVKAVAAIRDWAAGKKDDAPDAEVFRLFKNNTPFLNLFYTRAALDYLILYDIQEAVSPGSLRRMERRLKKDQNQEFILPPSKNRVRSFTR